MARKRSWRILALAALALTLTACGSGSDGGSHYNLRAEEVERVVTFVKEGEQPDYDEEVIQEIDRQAASGGKGSSGGEEGGDGEDELLSDAIEVVVDAGMASTSLLQRRLKVGYARAARLVDEMEQRGIVGPFEGSKPRQVLLTKDRWYEMKLNQGD